MSDSALLRMLRDALAAAPNPVKRHIVHFRSNTAFRRFMAEVERADDWSRDASPIQPIPIIGAISCSLRPGVPPLRHPSIRLIEEDVPIRVHAPAASYLQPAVVKRQAVQPVPWGVRQIKAPAAWKETRGARIRIGVIDTGIDYLHPDLRGRISRGINLIDRNLLPADDNGHGTHISGTIAAANPYTGVIGVAPLATLHPVKAFDRNGTAYVSDIVMGIDWCVRNHMHIINMSFGMKTRSKSLQEAIQNAHRHGVVVVASSGNDGLRTAIDFPARFPQTISVGATSPGRRTAPFSNRGKAIDLYAPGDKIRSTWLHRSHAELSGTSMATSHVSGLIALMLTLDPTLTPADIKSLLQRTSNRLAGQQKKAAVKRGEIDAVKALRAMGALK